uniref:S-adenosyl-l-methionine decarboxylase leader peptide n=2 Tax=Solanum TaxID=4107 RepID=A0A3Q7EAR4_SOLLC
MQAETSAAEPLLANYLSQQLCLALMATKQQIFIYFFLFHLLIQVNDLMESKGGKKSSSKSSLYEAPLGYSIEDVRPNGGIKKFRSAAYSNCARKPS